MTTDVAQVLNAITPRTKVIYLAMPDNPTGTMPVEEDIHRLIKAVPDDVVIVADLAYGEFVAFDFCQRLHDRVAKHPNLIVTRTFSKAFSLVAFRLAWCNVPLELAPVINTLRAIGNVNGLAQAAGVAALSRLDLVKERVAAMTNEVRRVRNGLVRFGFTVEDTLTNFFLVKLPEQDRRDVDDWRAYLYSEAAIVIRRVREPGLQHYARICSGTEAQNSQLLTLSEAFLSQGCAE